MIKICILMSTYNGQEYIRTQMDSILSQEGNFEFSILVRDDGSKDGTIGILEEYSKLKEVNIIYGTNMGWMKSFNELMFEASLEYDYYAFADQDDIWFADKLSAALTKIQSEDESLPILYGGNVIEVDDSLTPLDYVQYTPQYALTGMNVMMFSFALGCTMLFNRSALITYRRFPKKMRYVGHDWLLATIVAYYGKLIYDDRAYMYHIRHGNNCSGTLNRKETLKAKYFSLLEGKIGYTVYEELYNGYMKDLPEKDQIIIMDFMNYTKCIKSKLRLLINNRVRKITVKGTLLLKLAILLNKHV